MLNAYRLAENYFIRLSSWKKTVAILAVALLLTSIASLNVGYSQIPLQKIIASMLQGFGVNLLNLPQPSAAESAILLQVRLPRIIAGILVGAALAMGGVAFQALFRNPMADPYVLGISSGATLGGVIAITLTLSATMLGAFAIPITAFLGAVLTSLLVYKLARIGSNTATMSLLLSGIAISIVLSALVTLAIFFADPYRQLTGIIFWLIGSLSSISWPEITAVAPLILVPAVMINFFARDLNVMLLGEEEARNLGVNTESLKKLVLVLSLLAVASAVSITGIIGFVGLMVPHIVRLIVGPDHRILLPSAMLGGAIYVTAFDAASRVIYPPSELPVGVLTALAGGPFFLYLLRRKKGSYRI